MKKLLIIQESMGGGGAERVLSTLLYALNPIKYDVTLLLIYGDGPFMAEIPANVKVKYLFKSYQQLSGRIISKFRSVRNLFRSKLARRVLGNEKFDVTISFMEGPTAKLHSQLMDYAPRNYTWVHCNLKKSHWYDQWFAVDEEKEFYRQVDKIAFVSQEVRDVFCDLYETDAQKEVVYNPVSIDHIVSKATEKTKKRDEVFTIVNVGRLVWQKNQSQLIEIAEILKSRGIKFRLLIVGEGILREQLEELIKSKKLENEVRLVGFKSNPFILLKNADVFCLTSVSEGWGMVVVEALALSLPVVSSPIAAVTEIINAGGGIVTDGTPEHFADVIEYLMDNPEELKRIARVAPEVAAKYDVSRVMESVNDFIDK